MFVYCSLSVLRKLSTAVACTEFCQGGARSASGKCVRFRQHLRGIIVSSRIGGKEIMGKEGRVRCAVKRPGTAL